jgi:uncharacterized protein (DUF433 family)
MDDAMNAARVYKDILWQDTDRHSGAVCFYGTRIPVQELFDWIDSGSNVQEFLRAFPHVGSDRVHAVLSIAGQRFDDLLERAA